MKKPDGYKRRRKQARKRIMRLATWNVQGISTKVVEVFREIEKYNMDIVALTETKKKGKGNEEKQGYIYLYSGVPKEERAQSGVALVVKKKYRRNIKTWEQINDRLLQVEMEIKNNIIVFVVAYAPNEDAPVTKKDLFYDELTRTLDLISDRKEIVLLGDLNARTGSQVNHPIVGRFGEDTVNNNGERLIELCHRHGLQITNGWFQHKDIHRYTWTQPTRNLKSIIDYIIVRQQPRLRIHDVKVQRGPECGSDHHLLAARMYLPYKQKHHTTQDESTTEINTKYNLESLNCDSTRFLYQLRLAAKLTQVTDNTPNNMYELIKQYIHEAAYEALGEQTQRTRNNKYPSWWNDTIEISVEAKRKAYEKWLQTKAPEDRDAYKNRRREVQHEVNKAKNEEWDKACEEVNECMGNTRANKAWKIVRGMRTNENNKAGVGLIGMTDWVEYYKDLLKEDRVEFMQEDLHQNDIGVRNRLPPISVDEVKDALTKMKNRKSPGPGNVNIELIKAAPSILIEILSCIFNKCSQGQEPPDEWKNAIISSIYKKGGRQDCKNYRGISVTSSVARLYGRVMKTRIEEQFIEEEEQNGFRAGRSCIDGVFTLKTIIEKRVARGRSVHLVFIDLQKAYDTVPLNKLWPSMREVGINEAYINAVKKLYNGCRSAVKMGGKISQEFCVTKGLRQGCPLAPLLFKIYIQQALRTWKQKCNGMGIPIGDQTLYTLLFADDQVIVAGDQDDASYMLRKLKEEFEKFGLTINTKKTEYMAVGEQHPSDLNIGPFTIKHRSYFKYLGVILSSNGKSGEDISSKIGQGKRVIRQLNSLLWSRTITRKTKAAIYGSIMESISTYGAETWELTQRNKDRLVALEMDFWRRSSRVSRLDHVRNETVRLMMNAESTILDSIEGKRLTWFGHLQRMEDSRWPKKVWEWIPPERRKRGRPPRSWKKDVEQAMTNRGLHENDWWDRQLWKSRSGKRQ